MTILESAILGIVQGLTEFLPVSSSAHLIFFQNLFGLKEPQLLFDVSVHFATMLAIIVMFYSEILRYFKNPKILFFIILATIPTGLIGIIIKKKFEFIFSSVNISAICLLITGLYLYISEKLYNEKKEIKDMGWFSSLLIGTAQGIAVLPGISRSGFTLSTSLILKFKKTDAFKFVFILSIPAVVGATFLELKSALAGKETFQINFLFGLFLAFVFGLLALKFFSKIMSHTKLHYFSYYCLIIALIILVINNLFL